MRDIVALKAQLAAARRVRHRRIVVRAIGTDDTPADVAAFRDLHLRADEYIALLLAEVERLSGIVARAQQLYRRGDEAALLAALDDEGGQVC